MNVFVLCTGRCGSVTFYKACQHITNYTAGHESKTNCLFDDRVDFPDNHIEIDNRLSWFLGKLERVYNTKKVFYVHLLRSRKETADSFNKRWGNEKGILAGYARNILTHQNYGDFNICLDYFLIVLYNI